MSSIATYKDLIVWQRSIELVTAVYQLTDQFPDSERYVLVSQIRRAVISISSNIAEGKTRGTRKDYRLFLLIAFSSGAELETQMIIAKNLSFSKNLDYNKVDKLLEETMKMLYVLINRLDA